MFKWSEVLEDQRERLIKVLENIFNEAIDYRTMQYIAEIYKDGTIIKWSCVARSNTFSSSSYNGDSLEVARYDFSDLDIAVTEEDFRRHMTEEERQDIEYRAKEDNLSFLNYIYSSGKYRKLIEEVEQEWIDWYKDEYAYISACDTVDYKIYDEMRAEGN